MKRLVEIILMLGLGATLPPDSGAVQAAEPQAARARSAEEVEGDVLRLMLQREWAAYRSRYITAEGRVIDNANGDISHSEGQGYALHFAAKARDAAAFERIWRWTRKELYGGKKDGLAAWKWEPASGKVADYNNATDGDILISWALGEAALAFSRPDYEEAGRRIAEAIGTRTVRMSVFGPILLPAAAGFEAPDRPDGPVVNLSYWVYPAFPTLKRLAPKVDWDGIEATGRKLTELAQFGPRHLPSDWVSLAGAAPAPAAGFPAQFSYNAIRIPLYLAGSATTQPKDLIAFAALEDREDIPVVDVNSGATADRMGGSGMRLTIALARCVVSGKPIADMTRFTADTFYYPASLNMFAKWIVTERYPQCL